MSGWTTLKNLVKGEIKQREEEGCNVEGFYERFEKIGEDEKQLMSFYNELACLEISKDFPFYEPIELEEIRKSRDAGTRKFNISESEDQLKDRFNGAWLGRSIGCALGKPIEYGDYMGGSNGRPGWKNVELWFKGANAWPISNYAPTTSTAKEEFGLNISMESKDSLLENIKFMETDDDIRYTVLGLKLLEEKGLDWDSWDLGKFWLENLPYQMLCTAEIQAYLNFSTITNHSEVKPDNWKEQINWVRTHINPYREWIGAQIRVDGYAYGAAGNPELAAELAYKDAAFSHVKNGVYGAMFFSAVISAAFVEKDIDKLIEIGLSQIPNNSRLYHDLKKAIKIGKEAKDQLELADNVYEAFKHYHCVHTNNNAALCVASLVFAKGDFEKAITTAVMGWDTDCNGATVGSIMGALVGAKNIPEKWSKPLNDTLYSAILGFHPIAISECAQRSYNVFNKIRNSSSNRLI
ncbi:ADP-ribosylglycohydrolase family protein [Clostridium lacusfryxellense]|uniref:ADP-ribosylglycohydrolase family protein n=1 Tax=Clostridium lacusfryxellense TaxID=205328 RepID=UPI001C0D4CFE|nr:ADP-ribosylglycohydrolase family protein [Clostridium lacusfryxellense]MBU3113290.1 ADP-ribosylglycohydrolase family protein [Clostridium lacusfryxellense]